MFKYGNLTAQDLDRELLWAAKTNQPDTLEAVRIARLAVKAMDKLLEINERVLRGKSFIEAIEVLASDYERQVVSIGD